MKLPWLQFGISTYPGKVKASVKWDLTFPVDTRPYGDVVMQLLLSRDVVPPYHDVVTTLQKRRRLKDNYTASLCCF